MESCVPANSFLRNYLLRGAIGSKNSWESTGRALYDYLSFLQAHDLTWTDVKRGEEKNLIAAYRGYCFDTAGLARNTVRQRILYVCKFYEFALKEGWIERLPFSLEERNVLSRQIGYLAHGSSIGTHTTTRDVMPSKHQELPKFLSKDEIKSLLAAATNPHHKMIIRMALQTGLRRAEIATFPTSSVFNPLNKIERNFLISLDPRGNGGQQTKGSKSRSIWISRSLMTDLYYYASQIRGERASLTGNIYKNLFLTIGGEPFADNGKSIGRIVSHIGQLAHITVHPHMLRHTYATHTLCALQRHKGDTRIEPLVYLQRQLGHASINTTMIYLHLINDLVDDAILQYDDELNDWVAMEKCNG